MTEHVTPIGTGDQGDTATQQMSLDSLMKESAVEEVQSSNFSKMAEEALGAALSQPDSLKTQDSLRESMMSPLGGAVGDEKRDVLSDVSRPGTDPRDNVDPKEDQRFLIDRTRDLYSDLTIYNVAWGVAMRMQKDISQLLRGT